MPFVETLVNWDIIEFISARKQSYLTQTPHGPHAGFKGLVVDVLLTTNCNRQDSG